MNCLLLLLCGSVLGLVTSPLAADDWPQWMGPTRDNVWHETGILQKFPDGGPKILWKSPVAGGYAGPSVAGEHVVVTDYVTSENVKVDNFQRKEFSGMERVLCLNSQTGEIVWKHEYPVKYSMSYPAGPRCTPVIDEGLAYTLGGEGHLFCFNVSTGEQIWAKNLTQDYHAKTPLWGYAAHPLVDGEKLICLVGGEGSHAVAFNKKNGEEIWRSLSATEQGYSPPKIFEFGGKRQLLLLRPNAFSAVNPDDGQEYWSVPYDATNGSVIMTPIQKGNVIYAAGYNNKNMLVDVADDGMSAKIRWQDLPQQAISPVNVQPFRVDEQIYGLDQSGLLYCINMESGQRIWQSGEPLSSKRPVGSGTAFIVRNGDHFWLFNELGELIIANMDQQGYHEIDRAKVIEQTNEAFGRKVIWSMPAFAQKRAFIRNDEHCICVDLAQ